MSEILGLLGAASLTAVATGLGAIPVFFLGARADELRPLLLGLTSGIMSVAAIDGLLRPAIERGSTAQVVGGTAAGIGFLLGARLFFERRATAANEQGGSRNTWLLVFLVLLVHSLPEGFAIGTAWASDQAGLSLFVVVAIAAQNIPEGTSVAIPMAEAGEGRARMFWAAILTSVPQPVGALIAFLLVDTISGLLPISFAFAGAAMAALVAIDLLPQLLPAGRRGRGGLGFALGSAAMLALSVALQV